MLTKALVAILILVVCGTAIIRGLKEIRAYTKRTIPQQLVELVRQAYSGQPFQTLWDIEVSDAMRTALQAPLSVQQIESLSKAEAHTMARSVRCYLTSHQLKATELTGVVNVSIDISSESGMFDCHVADVKLRIVVRCTGNHAQLNTKWVVSSVEQL